MRIPQAADAGSWNDAVRRATAVTAGTYSGGMDETCWDDVAVRNIVAMVLYALHLRDEQPIEAIRWNAVLWQLHDDRRVDALVNAVLQEAGHDLSRTASPGDPVAEHWRWLTRTWNPEAPTKGFTPTLMSQLHQPESGWVPDSPEPRWGGMSRGIGSGLPDPALEVCTHWAAGAVETAIISERGGYPKFQRVRVASGPLHGQRGYVKEAGWTFDDTKQTADGPSGYVVDLDDTEGTWRIDATHLNPASDQRWPRRPAGTLKDGPPPGLHRPLVPLPSCAEDLQRLLDRASDPEVIPSPLRRRIASAKRHHHLQLDCQASPSPARFTWRILQHWYQLGEPYDEDQIISIYEVEVKSHLHDSEPTYHLALSESDVPAVVTRYTVARP